MPNEMQNEQHKEDNRKQRYMDYSLLETKLKYLQRNAR